MTHGASPEAWAHFDLILGLGADLLPVVSNPAAVISPDSKMKGLGKTPSIYNGNRQVAGIPRWTERQASPGDISRWSAEPDYGICLQTRRVRALDIDIPDQALADQVERMALAHLPAGTPVRMRSNSGKRVLAFIVEGDLPKRAFKTEGGLVELLATGQQFIVAGRHDSGVHYQWAYGLPDSFPVITQATLDALWADLVANLALEPDAVGSSRARQRGADLDIEDDVVDWLEAEWETFGYGSGGQLFVTCPWKDGHSGDSGDTEAAWFPAGTGGYQVGHYRCLHASCASRKDEDFLDAVGYRASGFDVVLAEDIEAMDPGAERAAARREAWPSFVRNKKGQIEPIAGNVQKALLRSDFTGFEIGYDEFRGQIMCAPEGSSTWRPFEDRDYFTLRVTLEQRGFAPVGKELARDAVIWVAGDNRFDSATQWLAGLTWDGVPRVETFFAAYFGAEDTPYTRAVSRYAWSALAARTMSPGCQVDMVPIAVGGQGLRKSSGFRAMSPSNEFFAEFNLTDRDDNLSRKMRGTLVGEMAELRGLRTRDAEGIKAWVTQRFEKWTPKYQEFETTFPRRLVLFGTSNPAGILDDETGNRRWLPFMAGDVDVAGIERDRDQLWAEGAALFAQDGVAFAEAERLAAFEHDEFRVSDDAWEEAVSRWLDAEELGGGAVRDREFVTTLDALVGAVGMDAKNCKRGDEMRMGKVLRVHGYASGTMRVNGKVLRVWRNVSLPLA